MEKGNLLFFLEFKLLILGAETYNIRKAFIREDNMRILVALIIIIPALEISVLIFSGKTLGIPITLLLIILTGVIGAWLAKKQGLDTLRRAQQQMSEGQAPGEAIMDGICILIGGVLLLSPGYITDLTGFFLLFPATRNLLKPIIGNWIRRRIERGNFTVIRRW